MISVTGTNALEEQKVVGKSLEWYKSTGVQWEFSLTWTMCGWFLLMDVSDNVKECEERLINYYDLLSWWDLKIKEPYGLSADKQLMFLMLILASTACGSTFIDFTTPVFA